MRISFSLLFIFSLCITTFAEGEEVGVRIRFGIEDSVPTDWSGSIAINPGRITDVTGLRLTALRQVASGGSVPKAISLISVRDR